jgi:hypothetical protein
MFLCSALVAIFALPTFISGGQIPVVDGVIGGVPSGNAHNSSCKTLKRSGLAGSLARTLGKLHSVVENSYRCVGSFYLIYVPYHIHSFGKETRCLSGFWIW